MRPHILLSFIGYTLISIAEFFCPVKIQTREKTIFVQRKTLVVFKIEGDFWKIDRICGTFPALVYAKRLSNFSIEITDVNGTDSMGQRPNILIKV